MSRLCRLKTAAHGEDGKWAYSEIVKLRAENAKQAEQIKRLRDALGKYRDNVLFRIGSASPYRQVAKEYFEFIKPLIDEALSATLPVQDSQTCDTCANNGNTRGVCQNATCNWDPRDQVDSQRGDGWMPIDTAPKDGTFILVWNSNGINEVYWDADEESWRFDVDYDCTFPLRGDHPTLWQPLPAAPAQKG